MQSPKQHVAQLKLDAAIARRFLNSWVKKLGQWHLHEHGADVTLCGTPMLGNNYSRHIPESERERCPGCFGKT